MKRNLLSTFCIASIGIAAYATTYMYVEQSNNEVDKYDVDNVIEATFSEDQSTMNVEQISYPSVKYKVDNISQITFDEESSPENDNKTSYTVSFFTSDSVLIETQKVFEGESAVPSTFPVEEGCEFHGWSKSTDNVQTDMSVYAICSKPFEYVDLGLSVKWATFNIGAEIPEEIGSLYAWGETDTKEQYDESTYSLPTLYGLEGTKYDVAHVRCGGYWRMPKKSEWEELFTKCSCEITRKNGIRGFKVTADNGNWIFLPSYEIVNSSYGEAIFYRASDVPSTYKNSSSLKFETQKKYIYAGHPVRPVLPEVFEVSFYTSDSILIEKQDVEKWHSATSVSAPSKEGYKFVGWSDSPNKVVSNVSAYAQYEKSSFPEQPENYAFVDLGLPSGLKWATINIGATNLGDTGDLYAWGEIETKDVYEKSTYSHYTPRQNAQDADGFSYTIEESWKDLGENISGTEYDVAHSKWKGDWRMPSSVDWEELFNTNYCRIIDTVIYGEKMKLVESRTNRNWIVLPQTAFWTSSLDGKSTAWSYDLSAKKSKYKYEGLPVRPVLDDYYLVSFYSSDSALIQTQKIKKGKSATYFDGPERKGYTFSCWSNSIYNVKSDIDVYAEYVEGEYGYVDLGLSVKWATSNIGSNRIEDYGDYYAWGEVETKENYSKYTYLYYKNKYDSFGGNYTYEFANIGVNISKTEYDVAHKKRGGDWCMPSYDEWKDLIDKCQVFYESINGIKGHRFVSTINGKSIFLPYAGFISDTTKKYEKENGYYWTDQLYVSFYDNINSEAISRKLYKSSSFDMDESFRGYGLSIRPVLFEGSRKHDENGTLPGKFSISDTNKVQFSMGNLQYQASTNTWRFANKQYDFVGPSNSLISKDYDGWIDLFAYGTSGWNSGAEVYEPYTWTSSASSKNVIFESLIGDYSNADWGVYNPILNGGNEPGMWRTLSISEWEYLLTKRKNADSLTKRISINTYYNAIPGCLLLPDDWPINDIEVKDSYTLPEWNEMESKGAVFLPIKGDLNSGHGYTDFGYCRYWSSTCKRGDHNGVESKSGKLKINSTINGNQRNSVRLIQDVK